MIKKFLKKVTNHSGNDVRTPVATGNNGPGKPGEKEERYLKLLEESIIEEKRSPYVQRKRALKKKRAPSPVHNNANSLTHHANQLSHISAQDEPVMHVNNSHMAHQDQDTSHVREETSDRDVFKSSYEHDIDPGVVMLLEDGTVAIFKEVIVNKEYDLIYVLQPDGKIAPQGIVLYAYEIRRLGAIPEYGLERMAETLVWTRDYIIFHLDEYEYTRYIPGTKEDGEPAPIPAAPQPTEDELVRGREFRISIGGKTWNAVYWGRDQMGSIVAHKTGKRWSLMHLDLERFEDSLALGEQVSDHTMREIEISVLKRISEDL